MILERVLAKRPARADGAVLVGQLDHRPARPGRLHRGQRLPRRLRDQAHPGRSHPGGGRQLERLAGRRHGRRRLPGHWWTQGRAAGRRAGHGDRPATCSTRSSTTATRSSSPAAYSRSRDWLLDEHVVRGGDALIPGTGYLEIIRNAVGAGGEPRPHAVELRDVFFLSPFAVAGERCARCPGKLDARRDRTSWCSATPRRHRTPRATARAWKPSAGAAPRSRRDPRPLRRPRRAASTATPISRSWTSGPAGATSAGSSTATARRWSPPSMPAAFAASWRRCGCIPPCSTWPPAAPRR